MLDIFVSLAMGVQQEESKETRLDPIVVHNILCEDNVRITRERRRPARVGCPGNYLANYILVAVGLYSDDAMRRARSKNSVYNLDTKAELRHASKVEPISYQREPYVDTRGHPVRGAAREQRRLCSATRARRAHASDCTPPREGGPSSRQGPFLP